MNDVDTGNPPGPAPTIPELIAALDERVAALEEGAVELVLAEVGKVAGPAAETAVREALVPYVEKVGELTGKLTAAAAREEHGVDQWAHAKIDALTNAVKRAIGIDVPMPSKPGEVVTGDVTVPGAETADQLATGKT